MVAHIEKHLGNYRLLRLLGKGGFAEVYLGQHLYLKSYAALKVLRTSIEDEDVAQFMAEAQTLARLAHPHIVRVLDFDVIEGFPMLVMEYSPGGTLRHRYPPGSCLSLETTVKYIKQIASALQYAHNHDVIHRDVKPENILLESPEHVRLSDFGLALFAPSPEQLSTQEMAGTIPYMAPEQLQGKPCLASDQYALGIVAYEWLCGARPFEGNYWQLAYQHISSPPPSLREKDPSLPASIEAVVLKALAKDPQQRYASAQLFAQALEQATQAGERDLRAAFEVTAPLRAVSPVALPAMESVPHKVFLSAFSDDQPFVARLSADLQARGISIWDAHPEATQPAGNEREALRQAMRAVDALLFVAFPAMQSSRVAREHLQLAAIYKRPIIYIQTGGDETIETLPLVEHISVVNAHPARYIAALDEIVACLERESSNPSGEEVDLATPESASRNPYKGLRAFLAEDARDFFGREALIAELTNQLRELLSSGPSKSLRDRDRLLTVIGPSGSGKSSVVMAGLLPRLTSGALPGSDRWVYLDPIVPGTHPIESLSLALAPHFPNRSVKSMREDLEDDAARGLHLLAAQLVKVADQKVALLVDQCEELFTLTTDEAERQHFIDLLVTAATEPGGPLLLILTLRADFYDRPMAYPGLGRLILRHQCVVLPMEMYELREAIKHPAALPDVQLTFESNLVGDLLYDVRGQPGALPLLQFTLDQLFQRRSGSLLTLKAYREIGGVQGALAKHAETTYAELPSDKHRALARSLFLRLIDPGYTEQDTTRRRAPLDELTLITLEENELLQQVIAYFLATRLLTTSVTAGISMIEVSHEALIREWPRLADWLWEAREDVRLQQTLSEDVAEWEQRDEPKDRLYRGSQLKEAKAWVKRNTPSKREAAFLRASTARQKRTRLTILTIVLLILLLAIPTGLLVQQLILQFLPQSVTTLKDNGPGSLRQVVLAAKPGSTITFDPSLGSGPILLTSGDVVISKNLIIRGPDTGLLFISGTHGIHVLLGARVTIANLTFKGSELTSDPLITNDGTLTLTNSTLRGNTLRSGSALDPANGFIVNHKGGILTLMKSTVSGNTGILPTTFNGGGPRISTIPVKGVGYLINCIYNNGGALTLNESTVSANRGCGGISNDNNGILRLSNSTVSDNDQGGIFSSTGTVTINSSKISGNKGQGIDANNYPGFPTFSVSTLTINNSTISDNSGIGISASGLKITFSNGTISGNRGGGINTAYDPYSLDNTLTLTHSTISDNISDNISDYSDGGGGVNMKGVQAYISYCIIYGNTAHQNSTGAMGEGGGIYNDSGTLTLTSSTVSGNSASASGGGIYNEGGTLTLINSTVSGNSASANGGGIFIQSTTQNQSSFRAQANLTFSTIYSNKAPVGADIAVEDDSLSYSGVPPNQVFKPSKQISQVKISTSIIVGDPAHSGPDVAGTLTSYGYDLFQDNSGTTFDPSTAALHNSTDKLLSANDLSRLFASPVGLRNNGGPTATYALAPGSPAIDAIPLQDCQLKVIFDSQSRQYIDQRGVKRPQGKECDIGAYEFVPA